jgi:DNA-binding transcriptional LysR family regulator
MYYDTLMDTLERMETFVRVVEGGSLSAAARARGLSLAAVSRQLASLEAELGTPLVVRTTRRLRVTEAGQRWYGHCVQILEQLRRARDEIRGDAPLRGRLVVSAPVTLGTALLLPRLPALVHAHPELQLELRLEDRLVELVADAVDVAVRGGVTPPDSPGLVARRWLEFRRVVVASPAYVAARGAPSGPAALSGHRCLLQGPLDRWQLGEEDVQVCGPVVCSAPLALKELALQGLGLALLPEWLVPAELASGALVRVLPDWASPPVPVWALHRIELRGSPRVTALLGALGVSSVAAVPGGTRSGPTAPGRGTGAA